MNNSRLWLTWMTHACELKALDAMSNLRLWMTWATSSSEIRAQDSMNNLALWMIRMILNVLNSSGVYFTSTPLGHELKTLDARNSLGMWMTWSTPGHEPRTLEATNSSWLWLTWMTPMLRLRFEMLWTAQGCVSYDQLGVMSSVL